MKTKRSFRLQKLKFLMCTLRKSHFCGAPASRMKYSRVNLEYHHTLQCIGCAAECWASSQLFLKLLNCKARLHTKQWKLSPPSPVWDYQEFDPGLKFWSLCNISRVIMQTLPKALRTQALTALTSILVWFGLLRYLIPSTKVNSLSPALTAVTAVASSASFARCFKPLAAKPQFHFNVNIA